MLNSIAFIIGITMMYAAPLIYSALGGVISENSGVVNIGLEGMMAMGAFTGAVVAYFTGNPWFAFLCAGITGALLALIHAVVSITFNGDQIISGTAINFIGPGFALFFSRIFFNGATQTKQVELSNKIPKLFANVFPKNSAGDLIFNQYATVYLAFLMVVIVWFVLYRTKFGLRVRAVGEHPRVADTLGINVYKIRYLSVILSGVLSGFGGAAMSIAVVSNFTQTLISGQGFIALAAMIFGRYKPQGALVACLIFGAAQAITVVVGGGSSVVPPQILSMLPYALTIIVLMIFKGKCTPPAADGKPYEKGSR